MKLSKSTRYALYASMEMAAADERLVTVSEVAQRYGIPETALAKVFQQLVRSGLAIGSRGVGGGYRLARPASGITVLDVIQVYEPLRPDGNCHVLDTGQTDCERTLSCRLRGLLDEVEELARNTYASVTLEALTR